MLMRVNFEAAGWWYVIEPGEGEEINYPHDRLALAAILRSVPADMLSNLRDRRTSSDSTSGSGASSGTCGLCDRTGPQKFRAPNFSRVLYIY
jgi:hypothetical protein